MALATEKRKAKEDFCKSLGWSIDIHWFGVTGYSEISGLLVAKIDMAPGAEFFNRFHVAILNKNEGWVDGRPFMFNDYLDNQQKPGLDVQVVMNDMDSDGKFGWHRCEIDNTRPLTDAIEDYIAQFR